MLSQTTTGSFTELLPNGFKRAYTDLSFLTSAGQALRLDISVGNGFDSSVDSVALIDNLVLRVGEPNFASSSIAMRIMSSQHDDESGSSSSTAERGTYQFRVKPGQNLAFRTVASSGQAWALLFGQELRLGQDFGFGILNLQIPTIGIIFDGIAAPTFADALLGTLNVGHNYIAAQVPATALPGPIAFQGLSAEPFSAFGYGFTSATNLIIDTTTRIPVGATQALDAGANNLGLDDTATIPLATMSGGGFNFYGTLRTTAYMNSHGYVTFGGVQNDFTPTVSEFFTAQPKVAALWRDLNPQSIAGAATFDVSGNVARFTWQVADTDSSSVRGNHFTIELWVSGEIVISYESINVPNGIVGITPGGLTAPSAPTSGSNLSGFSFIEGARFSGAANAPIFQAFDTDSSAGTSDANDLMTLYGARLTFVPVVNAITGAVSYDCYSGTR